MTEQLRVLIADDSAVVRRIVAETLRKDPEIDIVGAARNGKQALELIDVRKPDVVVLDLEMPVMDGTTVLKTLRKTDRRTPVIMFSALTAKGAESTLDALALGASDYVTKPSLSHSASDAVDYLKQHLVPLVLQWGRQGRRLRSRGGSAMTSVRRPKSGAQHAVEVIAIGSSTGGPNALADVLAQLPADLGLPVVVVQHMPKVFTRILAERLDRSSPLTVREGEHDAPLRAGEVWIAPGDYHMTVVNSGGLTRLSLNQAAQENSCRPAVDVLFRSVAEVYGGRCLAAVLTGMGKDGLEGCRLLRDKGAHIIAQDEGSSVVWGMPRAVAEAGLADRILPLDKIASRMISHCQKNAVRRSSSAAVPAAAFS